MTKKVFSVTPRTSIDAARAEMKRRRIRHLVVASGRKVVGVVSDRDLGRAGARNVDDVMSTPAVTATPDTTVKDAANLLRGHTIGCLPVVERGAVVGMLTITDLLEMIGRGMERTPVESKRWTLTRPAAGRRRQRTASARTSS